MISLNKGTGWITKSLKHKQCMEAWIRILVFTIGCCCALELDVQTLPAQTLPTEIASTDNPPQLLDALPPPTVAGQAVEHATSTTEPVAPQPPDISMDQSADKQWWIPLPEGVFPPVTGKTPEAHRHMGLGQPLTGPLSWSALPHTAGFYIGGLDGAQSVNSHLTHQWGTTFGLRFGIDYDYHWGIEKRFGFASLETREAHTQLREQTELEFGDVDLYFYPWGDSRWRPYMLTGIGVSRYNHEDGQGHLEKYLLTSPFGIGLKRLVGNGLNMRMEIADNLLIGRGNVGSMNNMSLSAGAEFRYHGLNWIRKRQ